MSSNHNPKILGTKGAKRRTSQEKAFQIKSEALSMLSSANSVVSAERRVTNKAGLEVVWRSLNNSRGFTFAARRAAALQELSEFIAAAQGDFELAAKSMHSDLFSVSHPFSTSRRALAMTASARDHAQIQWLLADPSVTNDIRPLVASALASDAGSAEYTYAVAGLRASGSYDVLSALVAAFGGGNSYWALSMRAKLQRRDRLGRFAYMGGGLRALIRKADGSIHSLTGRVVGMDANSSTFDMETPDGLIHRVEASKSEGLMAVLDAPAGSDGYGPSTTPSSKEMGSVLNEADVRTYDAPAGWEKVAGSEKTMPDGTKFTQFTHSSKEYSVGRFVSSDGTRKFVILDEKGTEKGKKIAEGSSWADVADALRANTSDDEKRDVMARLGQEGLTVLPEEDLAGLLDNPDHVAPAAPEAAPAAKTDWSTKMLDIIFDAFGKNPDGTFDATQKLDDQTAKIIDIGGRKTVLMDINGVKVPFYLSTGLGGKENVPTGKWYPVFGIEQNIDNRKPWINKGTEAQINDYYGVPEFKEAAQWLDENIGDIRSSTDIPQPRTGNDVSYDKVMNQLNQDMQPVSIRDREGFARNMEQAIAKIDSGRAANAPAAPEVAPSPSEAPQPEVPASPAAADVLSRLATAMESFPNSIRYVMEQAKSYLESGQVSSDSSPAELAQRLETIAQRAEDNNTSNIADKVDLIREVAAGIRGRETGIQRGEQRRIVQEAAPENPTFDVPAGMYPLDLENFSPEGASSPEYIANRANESDIQDALVTALHGDGTAEIDLGDGGELATVSAESLYKALEENGLDAQQITKDIYSGNIEQPVDEAPAEVPSLPEQDIAEAFDQGLPPEEIAQLEQDANVVPQADQGADFEEQPSESNLPPLLEGLTEEETQRLVDSNFDYTPWLPTNEDVQLPAGYHQLDPAPFPFGDIFTVKEGDEWNQKGFPVGWTNDPWWIADNFSSTRALVKAFKASLRPNAKEPGYVKMKTVDENGDPFNAYVTSSAVRDALQLQGVDTNAILNDLASEGRSSEPSDAEIQAMIDGEGVDINAPTENAPEEVRSSRAADVVPQDEAPAMPAPEETPAEAVATPEAPVEETPAAPEAAMPAKPITERPTTEQLSDEMMKQIVDLIDETGAANGVNILASHQDGSNEIFISTPRGDFRLVQDLGNPGWELVKESDGNSVGSHTRTSRAVEQLFRAGANKEVSLPADKFTSPERQTNVPVSQQVSPDSTEQYIPQNDIPLDAADTLPDATPPANITRAAIETRNLQPGDVTARDGFVITAIGTTPDRYGKVEIQGYYPGHQPQENPRKKWKQDTPIDVVRGIPADQLPQQGDRPEIHQPRYRDYTGGVLNPQYLFDYAKWRGQVSAARARWNTAPDVARSDFNSETDPHRLTARADQLKAGDVTSDPNRGHFVITKVSEDPTDSSKILIEGYYPGHQMQEADKPKRWNRGTTIDVVRNAELPEQGDLPPFHAPMRENARGNMVIDTGNAEAMAEYNRLQQEAGARWSMPDGLNSVDISTNPSDTPVGQPRLSRPDAGRGNPDPVAQGAWATILRDANGNPVAFRDAVKNAVWYAFDYETTGLDSRFNSVWQMGVVKFVNGVPTERLNLFMNPEQSVRDVQEAAPWLNLRDANGDPVTDEWLQQQQSIADAHRQFAEFVGENPLMVGQNVRFDREFLERALSEAGIDLQIGGYLDNQAFARALHSDLPEAERPMGQKRDWNTKELVFNEDGTPKMVASNSLGDVARHYGVPIEHHMADEDARATGEVLMKMLDKMAETGLGTSAMNVDAEQARFDRNEPAYQERLAAAREQWPAYLMQQAVENAMRGQAVSVDDVIAAVNNPVNQITPDNVEDMAGTGVDLSAPIGVDTTSDFPQGKMRLATRDWILDPANTREVPRGGMHFRDLQPGDFMTGSDGVSLFQVISVGEIQNDGRQTVRRVNIESGTQHDFTQYNTLYASGIRVPLNRSSLAAVAADATPAGDPSLDQVVEVTPNNLPGDFAHFPMSNGNTLIIKRDPSNADQVISTMYDPNGNEVWQNTHYHRADESGDPLDFYITLAMQAQREEWERQFRGTPAEAPTTPEPEVIGDGVPTPEVVETAQDPATGLSSTTEIVPNSDGTYDATTSVTDEEGNVVAQSSDNVASRDAAVQQGEDFTNSVQSDTQDAIDAATREAAPEQTTAEADQVSQGEEPVQETVVNADDTAAVDAAQAASDLTDVVRNSPEDEEEPTFFAPGTPIDGFTPLGGGVVIEPQNVQTPVGDSVNVSGELIARMDGDPERFEVVVRDAANEDNVLLRVPASSLEEANRIHADVMARLAGGQIVISRDPNFARQAENISAGDRSPEVTTPLLPNSMAERLRIIGDRAFRRWQAENNIYADGVNQSQVGDRAVHADDQFNTKGEGTIVGYTIVHNSGDIPREGYAIVTFRDGSYAIWATRMMFLNGRREDTENRTGYNPPESVPARPVLDPNRREQVALTNRYIVQKYGRGGRTTQIRPYIATNVGTTRRAYEAWLARKERVDAYRRANGLPTAEVRPQRVFEPGFRQGTDIPLPERITWLRAKGNENQIQSELTRAGVTEEEARAAEPTPRNMARNANQPAPSRAQQPAPQAPAAPAESQAPAAPTVQETTVDVPSVPDVANITVSGSDFVSEEGLANLKSKIEELFRGNSRFSGLRRYTSGVEFTAGRDNNGNAFVDVTYAHSDNLNTYKVRFTQDKNDSSKMIAQASRTNFNQPSVVYSFGSAETQGNRSSNGFISAMATKLGDAAHGNFGSGEVRINDMNISGATTPDSAANILSREFGDGFVASTTPDGGFSLTHSDSGNSLQINRNGEKFVASYNGQQISESSSFEEVLRMGVAKFSAENSLVDRSPYHYLATQNGIDSATNGLSSVLADNLGFDATNITTNSRNGALTVPLNHRDLKSDYSISISPLSKTDANSGYRVTITSVTKNSGRSGTHLEENYPTLEKALGAIRTELPAIMRRKRELTPEQIAELYAAERALAAIPTPRPRRSIGQRIWDKAMDIIDPAGQRAHTGIPDKVSPTSGAFTLVEHPALDENGNPITQLSLVQAGWRDSRKAAEVAHAAQHRTSSKRLLELAREYHASGTSSSRKREIEQEFNKGVNEIFGAGIVTINGYTVRETQVSIPRPDSTGISISVGVPVRGSEASGSASRTVRIDGEGNAINISNNSFGLGKKRGGNGFAGIWNDYVENWLIANNAPKVNVSAAGGGGYNGAYVWAITGFTFSSPSEGISRINDMLQMAQRGSMGATQHDIDDLKNLQQKAMDALGVSSWSEVSSAVSSFSGETLPEGFPTAMEIAFVGWTPEKDIAKEKWFGQAYMEERGWSGVKSLKPTSAARQAKFARDEVKFDRDAIKNGRNKVKTTSWMKEHFTNIESYSGDQGYLGEFANELTEFFGSVSNDTSIHRLSAQARLALAKHVNKLLATGEYKIPEMSDADKQANIDAAESLVTISNALSSARAARYGYDKLSSRGEALKAVPSSAFDGITSTEPVDLTVNGQSTGFTVQSLSGSTPAWKVVDTNTGEVHFIKKNADEKSSASEVAASALARSMGINGAPVVDTLGDNGLYTISTETGMNLNISKIDSADGETASNPYAIRLSSLSDVSPESMNLDNLFGMMALDALIDNRHRTGANVLLVQNHQIENGGSANNWNPIPLDHKASPILRGDVTDPSEMASPLDYFKRMMVDNPSLDLSRSLLESMGVVAFKALMDSKAQKALADLRASLGGDGYMNQALLDTLELRARMLSSVTAEQWAELLSN